MTRIVALVSMRHHSQRVPGKNYPFHSKTPHSIQLSMRADVGAIDQQQL